MNEVTIPRESEPRKLLQSIIEEEIPAIMSYLSRGKWHVAKIVLKRLGASRLTASVIRSKNPHPLNIQLDQPVGISLKYRYGKVVFDTVVTGFESSCNCPDGGEMVFSVPDRLEIVQRRSYFRVDVPKSLKVNVTFWHRCYKEGDKQILPEKYWQGRLVDISAGGLQIVTDAAKKPDFKRGQFVALRFTPLPYETPLVFSTQIRTILPTADGENLCFGMQIVGLEASPEGRQVLQRLCNVVEQYYQLNQSGVKQRDFQTTIK